MYTVDDVKATRKLIYEECGLKDKDTYLELDPQNQYVFGLVKGLRERYPLKKAHSCDAMIHSYDDKIKLNEACIESCKEEKNSCQQGIDMLINNPERDQKKIDLLIENRNKCQGIIDELMHEIKVCESDINKNKEKMNKYKEKEAEDKKYIFFSSLEKYKKDEHDGKSDPYRLDIEGENICHEKKYVRLQLQNHTGQNNSYASIFAPTDFPIHVKSLYFALNLAVYKYTTVTLLNKQNKNQIKESFIGVGAEKMKTFDDGHAIAQPKNLFLDDPIFTAFNRQYKKHLEEKHDRIHQVIDDSVKKVKEKKEQALKRLENKKRRK